MPDTIRTRQELSLMFPAQVLGSITDQELRDLVVSMLVHGEIGSGTKSAITLAATPAWTVLDFNVAGAVGRGLTIDTVNKRITGIPVALGADVRIEVEFTGVVNTTYEFAVLKNGASVARIIGSRRIVTVVQGGSINMSAALDLTPGDVLQVAVRPTAAGTPTFTLLRGSLGVKRIGIE